MPVRTRVDEKLAAEAEAHADDPERAGAIACARRFKSSWLELAEALTHLRASGRYRDWGYACFEDYARKELCLKQDTVDKLTGSFVFLKTRAPDVLSRDGVTAPIPSYQAIDFLSRAEQAPHAPKDVVEELRRKVLSDGAGAAQVARQYGSVVFPLSAAQKKEQDAAGLRNVAKRLVELLRETHVVPKRVADEAAQAVEQLLEALPDKGTQAA